MEVLDVQMAIHVYRQLGDAGMVMGLERIAYVEDKNLLAGHVALLFGNYQTAQVMATNSVIRFKDPLFDRVRKYFFNASSGKLYFCPRSLS